jgi:hypothetical protein
MIENVMRIMAMEFTETIFRFGLERENKTKQMETMIARIDRLIRVDMFMFKSCHSFLLPEWYHECNPLNNNLL